MKTKGLKITRFFTRKGVHPFDGVAYEKRSCRIARTDGSVVFECHDFEVPAAWSQNASDILISKYARRAGVPLKGTDGKGLKDKDGNLILGSETSVRQVVGRLAKTWRHWAEKYDYFDFKESADAYEAEMNYMLIHQMGAPNSPQWFNTGLNLVYGINGPAQGHYYADPKTGKIKPSEDAYTHPQPHACFIQSIKDDMVGPGGIMDLWMREARLFKYGSGTGTNFSTLRGRGEPLSGGGQSSGLMSFLRIGDRAAGAIKSGGTTRRAAKMVCLNIDHPEIEDFINWKVEEEKKVAALIAAGYDSDFNGDAYGTVSGQNSNNSVRLTNDFLRSVKDDKDFSLIQRLGGKVHKTVKARDLWNKLGFAAWACADPGVQFDTTINDWHTCPKDGRINASNPCSEYMFLDDTACNLASLNLMKFLDVKTGRFDIKAYQHAIRLWTMTLEISVLMAQYPSFEIAKRSYLYRTLGLGYANLGTVLMTLGLPYDSDEARAVSAALTAIMTGTSYETSAEMAKTLGAFERYEANSKDMLRVIANHRRAAYNEHDYVGLEIPPVSIDPKICPDYLLKASREAWDAALKKGERYGYRNAQVTVIAPTGTTGLVMDCDTTGVEPDFALVKFKKLAGGGYMKIVNQSVSIALSKLGYVSEQINDIVGYIIGKGTLVDAPWINWKTLKKKGFNEEDLIKIEKALKTSFEISMAFNHHLLGDEAMDRLSVTPEVYKARGFNLLKYLGFTPKEIEETNEYVVGAMTIEGAPHIKKEHLPVFDCANRCGIKGKRFIYYTGHIKMMAAVQPFISGAISKTINMPHEVKTDDVLAAYEMSWKLGLKANAIYRDGCKMSQPLNTSSQKKDSADQKEEIKEVEITKRALRRKLSAERQSITHKFAIAGHEGYFTAGLYDDGSPGELFIRMNKEGSTLSGIMDALALSISLNLQYGVPLEVLVSKFTHSRFEPSGMTSNKEIPMVKSIMDYLGRWLALKFLDIETAKKYHNAQLVDKAYKDGTMSNKGALPNMHRITLSEPQVKTAATSGDIENKLIEVLEKTKMREPKMAAVTASISSYSLHGIPKAFQNDDAPMCSNCGATMIRNGTCYKCLDCGETSGCS